MSDVLQSVSGGLDETPPHQDRALESEIETRIPLAEMLISTGSLKVRCDFDRKSVTIGLREFFEWHVDTIESHIAPQILHFVEPDGTLVGLKIFSKTH